MTPSFGDLFFVLARNGYTRYVTLLFFCFGSANCTAHGFQRAAPAMLLFRRSAGYMTFLFRPQLEMKTKSVFDHELQQRKQSQSHHIGVRS